MSKWIVDIHGDIEGDYKIIGEYKEPKTGHWIPVKLRNILNGDVKDCRECSECGSTYTRRYGADDGFETKPPYYCPTCGAKMEADNE